jgi:hypothetical protein
MAPSAMPNNMPTIQLLALNSSSALISCPDGVGGSVVLEGLTVRGSHESPVLLLARLPRLVAHTFFGSVILADMDGGLCGAVASPGVNPFTRLARLCDGALEHYPPVLIAPPTEPAPPCV